MYKMEDLDIYPTWADCAEDIENMMRFQCLVTGLQKHCLENLQYPEVARKSGAREAAIMLRVVIGPTGKVVEAKVARSLGEDEVSKAFEREAIRVVKSSPDMIPGQIGGQSASTELMFPIRFIP